MTLEESVQKGYCAARRALARYNASVDLLTLWNPGYHSDVLKEAIKGCRKVAKQHNIILNDDFIQEVPEKYQKYFNENFKL